jgi:hypothetical protein
MKDRYTRRRSGIGTQRSEDDLGTHTRTHTQKAQKERLIADFNAAARFRMNRLIET